MSDKLNIDTDAISSLVVKEAQTAYGDMWRKLRADQKALFDKLTNELSREYMAYTFGPPEEKEEHEANLKSLRNGMAALEGVVAIRAYRTTIALTGRVIADLLKASIKAAIGL